MSTHKTRQPAVAGRFYPDNIKEIEKQLNEITNSELAHMDKTLSNVKITGAVVPHAGYMFSAYQAVHFFEILKNSTQKFDTFIIINPNHTGYGKEISLDENDFWQSPLGIVEIDKSFGQELGFDFSKEAHQYEHSGEVMIPMLQHFINTPFKILPITISKQTYQNSRLVAESIFKANQKLKKNICIIASSDFSHFLSPEKGQQLDQYVINEILAFNSKKVEEEVKNKNISVCGYGPIMALIEYAKLVSELPKNKILKKGHSGEVIPSNEVVDYISILFYEDF